MIFFTYFFKSTETKKVFEEDKKEVVKKEDFKDDEINRFENVEYQGIDNSGNRFVIGSDYAQFEQERPEVINMEEIKCTFYFKDNTFLTIVADSGVFNNITNDMKFSDNVKIVSTAKSVDDATRMLELYNKRGKNNLISFAMGDEGKISRILCLYLGSPYTYVSLGKAVAPGQFSVDEVNKIINLKSSK